MTCAFVLASGHGERLWPLSALLPKPLWPVGGIPCARLIVDRLLLTLKPEDIFLTCLLGDKDLFQHEFRDIPLKIVDSIEPRGTSGELMPGFDYEFDEVVLHYGDCLVKVDFGELLRAHRLNAAKGAVATLVFSNNVRSELGQAKLKDEQVYEFNEKP